MATIGRHKGPNWAPIAPLTDAQVHRIRMLRGVETGSAVGLMFDRSQGVINQIQLGLAYRRVPWTAEERAHLAAHPTNSLPVGRSKRPLSTRRCPACGQLLPLIKRE